MMLLQEKGGAAMGWPNRMALQEKLALTDASKGAETLKVSIQCNKKSKRHATDNVIFLEKPFCMICSGLIAAALKMISEASQSDDDKNVAKSI